MSNGYIRYNPQTDPNQYLAQALNTVLSGRILEPHQRRKRGLDIQDIGMQLGVRLPQARTSYGQQLAASLLPSQIMSPLQQTQRKHIQAQTRALKEGKQEKLLYRDARGKMRMVQVPENQLSATVDQIIEEGGTIDTSKSTLHSERLNLYQAAKTKADEARRAGNEEQASHWAEQAELALYGKPMVEIALGQPAAAAERKEIAETRASMDALDNLKTLFDSTQTETGPITGRLSPIAGLVGMTTDEQEAFMAATSAFKNAIIKEITGAQMSEVEAKRIMKQVPDITDPPTRWNAKWEQSKKNLEFLQKRRLEILEQSGLRVPGETGQEIDIDDDIQSMSEEELKKLAGIE